MTHRRQEIREALATALTAGVATVSGRVFQSRVRSLWPGDELPCLLVYSRNDTVARAVDAPTRLQRTVSLAVECVAKADDDVDDLLDDVAEEVGTVVAASQWLAELDTELAIGDTDVVFSSDGDSEHARASITVTATYWQDFPGDLTAGLDDLVEIHADTNAGGILPAGNELQDVVAFAFNADGETENATQSTDAAGVSGYAGDGETDNATQGSEASGFAGYAGDGETNNAQQDGDATGTAGSNPTTWSAVGNSASFPGGTTTVTKFGAASLNSNDVVLVDDVSDLVRVSRYTAPNWGAAGSTYSVSSLTVPAITALDASTVAVFKSNTTAGLFTLSWNGSTFAAVGSQLNITGSNQGVALCRLSSTRVLLVDSQADYMRAYDWNGSTWAAAGNSYSLSGINGAVRVDALTSTLVVLTDAATNAVNLYSFDGTNWAAVSGSTLSVDTVLGVATNYPCVCALNSTDIVIGGNTGKIQAMRWNGSAWATLGSSYTVPNASSAGTTALVNLGSNQVAFMRASTSNSFLRRLQFT